MKADNKDALIAFLRDELVKLQNALNAVADGQLDVNNAAPAKPRAGMIRMMCKSPALHRIRNIAL